MVEIPENYYVFIIDTDSYSGNFERPMCAYLTGVTSECDRHEEYVELYKQEMGIEEVYEHNEHILFIPGEFGETPVSIYPTPGWFNDGHGNHYKDDENKEYSGNKYPLYQSVGIFMDRKPTDEEIKVLKKRANKFQLLKDYNKDKTPKILGFRLIQMKTTEVEIPI